MTETKILEIRDVMTCIPIIAVRFSSIDHDGDSALLSRAGWPCSTVTMISKLNQSLFRFWSTSAMYELEEHDTFYVALKELHENWNSYTSGGVIECGLLSGRLTTAQGSDV